MAGWLILFVIAGIATLAARCVTVVRFWLPNSSGTWLKDGAILGYPANYSTLASLALHALAWHALIGKLNHPIS
jgi:hypothetical protein